MDIRLGLSDGVVEILRPDAFGAGNQPVAARTEPHTGMGLVLSADHAITCAHVVLAAWNGERRPLEGASNILLIRYTHSADQRLFRARVVTLPEDWQGDRDCALIRMEEPMPTDVRPAILGLVEPEHLSDDRLLVFGKADTRAVGRIISARFMARVGSGYSQITDDNQAGTLVTGGFSGAGVWDRDKACFIGLLTARDPHAGARAAFLVPTASLMATLGDLPHEERNVTGTNQRLWMTVALTIFVFGLAHQLQGSSAKIDTGLIPWAKGDPTLAHFFGLHLTALLLPLLLFTQIRHACAFRLHDWHQRVPFFWSFDPVRSLAATKLSAALTLLFLLFAPVYAHWHFFEQTAKKAAVGAYIKDAEDLYNASCRGMVPKSCAVHKGKFTSPDFGFFTLINGVPLRNNGYHIGNADFTRTVTFFPRFQPGLLLALNIAQLGLFAWLLAATFRRPSVAFTKRKD